MAISYTEAQELHRLIGAVTEDWKNDYQTGSELDDLERALELAALVVSDTAPVEGTATAYDSIADVLIAAAESGAHVRLILSNGHMPHGFVLAANTGIVELLDAADQDGSEARYYATAHVISAKFD